MRILVTGATGYIGSAVAEKLRAAGHNLIGLARSAASAAKLEALGAGVVSGDMRDRNIVQAAAQNADAVIHLAAEYSPEGPALDRGVVEALCSARVPFLYTSGVWIMGDTGGHVVDESSPVNPTPLVAWRPSHEKLAMEAGGTVLRPAMVYGRGGGFVAGFASAARSGAVQVVGSGENRWPLVHVDDLADLYVLALKAKPGSLYFASAGPSVPVKQVAQQAARGARVEFISLEEARKTMGPLADALTLDQLISSRKAMEELGWTPKAKPVLEDLVGSA
jgi:nucleoside-diphosphate-sugar epimerase